MESIIALIDWLAISNLDKILKEARKPVCIPKVYIPGCFITSMNYLMDN